MTRDRAHLGYPFPFDAVIMVGPGRGRFWLHPAPDEAATSAAARAEAVNLIGRDRAPEALQLQLADRRSVERVFHGREDALADQDLTARRARAQPGCEAGDRPQRPVVVATFEADPPQCGVSGFDSDAKRQVDAALQPTAGELAEAFLCSERETESPAARDR